MSNQSKTHFYRWLTVVGVLFWIAESAFFGWNETGASVPEKTCDFMALMAMLWGIIGDIVANAFMGMKVVKHYHSHNRETHFVSAENLSFAPQIPKQAHVNISSTPRRKVQ